MAIDNQDKLDKAVVAIKAYQTALINRQKAEVAVQDKLVGLKNATGAANMDEALIMLGRVQLDGLPEVR